MKKLIALAATAGFAAGLSSPVFAAMPLHNGFMASHAIFAKEDCKDGEKWNEETQKCEAAK